MTLTGSGNTKTATCTTSTFAVGNHNVVASYAGDANNAAVSSPPLTQVVNALASTTELTSSANPASFGSSVTFTATVSGSNPTGSVTFTDGGSSISGCAAVVLPGSGNSKTATCTTSSLAVGNHSIVASYSGDAGNIGSTSTALSQVVNSTSAGTVAVVNGSFESPALSNGGFQYQPTTTGWVFNNQAGIQRNGSAWGASAAPDGLQAAFLQGSGAQMAQTINLAAGTYSVSFYAARRAWQGAGQPLQLSIGGIPVGTPITPISTAFALYTSATFTVTAGNHTLQFTTTNPTGDNSSFVDAVSLNALTTTNVSLTTSATPVTVGSSVTFTATVSGSNPTGSVTFTDGGSSISGCAAVVLPGSGNSKTATCTTSSLAVGNHSIVASYSGDAGNIGSTSTALSQVVNSTSAGTVAVVNGSFESPALSNGGFQYQPTTTGWVFNNQAGIQRNGSAWGASAAPDGLQAAFLQGSGAQMAQTINLAAGTYSVSFYAARRAWQGAGQPLQLSIGGIPVGTPITPISTAFALYTSAAFTVTAGNHTLQFTTTNPTGDNSSFVDAVVLNGPGGS